MVHRFRALVATLPRLDGKIVAITGCTSGTGYIAAKECAEKGAHVIMLNRDSERATKALAQIKAEVPGCLVTQIPCDLMDFAAVRKAADDLKVKFPGGLDVLCNNAGVMYLDDVAGKDGYDVQMTTNHLSHWLLTKELLPLLEAAAAANGEARIINHSSIARRGGPLEARYLDKNGGNLGGASGAARHDRYHQSKLANCVFTYALKERLDKSGSKVKVLLAHPGVASTNLSTTIRADGGLLGFFTGLLVRCAAQSQEDGTCGIMTCIAKPGLQSGEFWGPAGSVQIWGPAVRLQPEAYLSTPSQMQLLWDCSVKACGGDMEFKARA